MNAKTETKRQKRTVKAVTLVPTNEGLKEVTLETPLAETSLESEIEVICRKIAPVYAGWVKYYVETYEYDLEKAKGEAKRTLEIRSDEVLSEFLRLRNADNLNYQHFAELFEKDPQAMVKLWLEVKKLAREELENGFRLAGLFDSGLDSIYEKAQFLAVRESMIADWQPQNGIEERLIDMMALAFSQYLYWSGIAHTKAVREEKRIKQDLKQFSEWKLLYQQSADAIDQAVRLADSYNRQFLRTLRQLRDLRRYAPPVIVNNGGQVNVAQQQVNVSKNE